jgi:hypothetical protein
MSASGSGDRTEAGRIRSTKRFRSRIISSPARERRAEKIGRAFSGQSSAVTGQTMVSI